MLFSKALMQTERNRLDLPVLFFAQITILLPAYSEGTQFLFELGFFFFCLLLIPNQIEKIKKN